MKGKYTNIYVGIGTLSIKISVNFPYNVYSERENTMKITSLYSLISLIPLIFSKFTKRW